ncbi:MAG: hypothetical protein ABSG03_38125 [Bryobacteraceae bacterium]
MHPLIAHLLDLAKNGVLRRGAEHRRPGAQATAPLEVNANQRLWRDLQAIHPRRVFYQQL